jgi:broad specificity polyphosphatase/5'/3'-nucleotidase SurE
LSQAFDTETRNRYISDYLIASELVERFQAQTVRVLDLFLSTVLSEDRREAFLREPITWNINFPFLISDPAALRLSPIGSTRYGRCFGGRNVLAEGTVYQHEILEEIRDPDPDCDSSRVRSGCATVSPLDIWSLSARGYSQAIDGLCAGLSR